MITIFAIKYPTSIAFSFSIIGSPFNSVRQSDYLMQFDGLIARLLELGVTGLHKFDKLHAAMQLGVHDMVTLPGVTMERLVENSILGNNSYLITVKAKTNGKQKSSKRTEKILEEKTGGNSKAQSDSTVG